MDPRLQKNSELFLTLFGNLPYILAVHVEGITYMVTELSALPFPQIEPLIAFQN